MTERYQNGKATLITQHEREQQPKAEVWGDGCECWVVPAHLWTTHYGAVEPGSMVEYNPECPEHGEAA